MNFGTEDETLEFKKTTGELNEAMMSVCAMLNKHGMGTVYFGVLPNGEAVGQTVTDSTLRDISRKIFESIEPRIVPNIRKKVADDRQIIEVTFSGSDKPYSCKGIYYIRTADEDRILPPHELRQLFEYSKSGSWDAELTEYSIEDVSPDTLRRFFNKATACGRIKDTQFNAERLLSKLGLLKNGNLTNAAYLLFSKNAPIVLKMAVFATDEKLTFLDINRKSGNIMELMEEAAAYIKRNICWKADIVGMERVETPEIPMDALREIICNSFAHARYDTLTEHEICIHPSFIRIYNPGEFPIGYSPEDFVQSDIPSMIRNPLILKTLFLSDDVESYSSGFKRVYSACRSSHVPVAYEASREGFSFIFKRTGIPDRKSAEKAIVKDTPLSKDEKLILDFLAQRPDASYAQISEVTHKSVRTLQRLIGTLKAKGILERIGSTRGYWKLNLPE